MLPRPTGRKKNLKALLTAHEQPFPRTHDLNALANLLPVKLGVPHKVLAKSYFAVGARYPDDFTEYDRPLAQDLWQKTLKLAEVTAHLLARSKN